MKKNIGWNSTATIIVLLVLLGCAGPKSVDVETLFPQTKAADTPEPAPTITVQPTPSVAPSAAPFPLDAVEVRGLVIEKLCLEVLEVYDTGDEPFTQTALEPLKDMFGRAGIQVADEGADCDAQLKVNITAGAVSAEYGENNWCYTGSYARGEMILTTADGRQVLAPFNERISPPWIVTSCPRKAGEAPVAWATSKGVMDALSTLWSLDFLTAQIQEGNMNNLYANSAAEVCISKSFIAKEKALKCLLQAASEVNFRQDWAINSLGQLGEKALPAMPELIVLLEKGQSGAKNIYSNLQDSLITALKDISGEDFGADTAKWKEWWNSKDAGLPPGACTAGGTFIDEEGDVEEGYLDLLKVETSLEDEVLKVVFYLKELPQRVPINHRGEGMGEGSVDYYWGVDIDIDHDDATGVDGSWGVPVKGIDCRMSLFHFISGNQEFGSIDQFLAIMDAPDMENSTQHGDFSLDYEKRTIMMVGQVPGINETSELHFLAFKNFPDYERFDDFLCD